MEESENYAGVQHPKVTGLIEFTHIYPTTVKLFSLFHTLDET